MEIDGLTDYDTLVIGGGPSGSALGRFLALAGWKVLLVDRETPGCQKVCGGFLGPEIHSLLSELGLESEFRNFQKNEIPTLLISGTHTGVFSTNFRPGPGYAVDRARFDRWLFEQAQKAGVASSPCTRVLEVRRDSGLWHLKLQSGNTEWEVTARFLVRAHGRRAVKPSSTHNRHIFFACRAIYENVAELENKVALHFVNKGHVGLNSLGQSRATLCFYAEETYLKNTQADLDCAVRIFMEENPNIVRHLQNARRVSDWSSCQAEPDGRVIFYENHAFRVGDAVAMVQPVIGGGIPIAVHSGVILSRCLMKGESLGWAVERVAREYQAVWRREFGKRFRFASFLGRMERSEWMADAAFSVMQAVPKLFSWLVKRSRPVCIPLIISAFFLLSHVVVAHSYTENFTTGKDWTQRMSKKEKFLSVFAPYILYYRYGVPFRKPPQQYITDIDKILVYNPYLENEDVANILASTVYTLEPESRPAFDAMAREFRYRNADGGEVVYPRLLLTPSTPPYSQDTSSTE